MNYNGKHSEFDSLSKNYYFNRNDYARPGTKIAKLHLPPPSIFNFVIQFGEKEKLTKPNDNAEYNTISREQFTIGLKVESQTADYTTASIQFRQQLNSSEKV